MSARLCRRVLRAAAAGLVAWGVAACGNQPPTPEWQMNARGSLDRYVQAYLAGDTRAADAEFARARASVAATGRASLAARVELTRCAVQVASLVFGPCPGFEALREDAAAEERAYANYLAGRATAADLALLPAAHRGTAQGPGSASALKAMADPVSRLVAAGVMLQTGRAQPDTLAVAVDTASELGWRRPLLGWLGVQAQRAEQAGAVEEVARLRRRMALVLPVR